jgi:mannose/fructose/N-acetylgalactosamine-specific phosphotransferase system component IIB
VISLVRVDNRLIHGQVVEAWLPTLKVSRVVVADDEAASSLLIRSAMGLAVPSSIAVEIHSFGEADFKRISRDEKKTLVLVRDVAGAAAARDRGLQLAALNVGNVHFATGRKQISPSVFLSQGELDQLKMLSESGIDVEARAVPSERAIGLDEMVSRFGKES